MAAFRSLRMDGGTEPGEPFVGWLRRGTDLGVLASASPAPLPVATKVVLSRGVGVQAVTLTLNQEQAAPVFITVPASSTSQTARVPISGATATVSATIDGGVYGTQIRLQSADSTRVITLNDASLRPKGSVAVTTTAARGPGSLGEPTLAVSVTRAG